MTEQEIMKAFEGRWRFKSSLPAAWVKGVKELCLDFFQAGIIIAQETQNQQCPAVTPTGAEKACTPVLQSGGSFNTWWQLYDKKRGKEKCVKKWEKLTEKEKAECIAATPAYVASTPDKQYRKDPLTYLNQKAWNDEIIYRNEATKPTIEQQRFDKLASILIE